MRRNVSLGLLLCVAAGCFYPADRGRHLEMRLERLESDNAELQLHLKQAQAMLPKMDEKIAEVTRALESLDKAARRSGADVGVQMQKAVEDLAALRGQLEAASHRLSQLEGALASTKEENERRFASLKGEEAAKASEARRKAEELARPTDKKEFLALADQKAKGGELAVARSLYAEFLKKWAKDDLAGEAHFGLGETFFSEDRCREALFEYGKVIQEHAKTASAPEAFMRSADCFSKLKMADEARLALEEVVKSYPKSAAAKTAKARLAAADKAAKSTTATKKVKK